MERFYVVGVRKSQGVHTAEGGFSNERDALERLDALGADEDCLLAEIEEFPVNTGIGIVSVIAQADRSSGEWRRVVGELRPRSRDGEARAILRDANQPGT